MISASAYRIVCAVGLISTFALFAAGSPSGFAVRTSSESYLYFAAFAPHSLLVFCVALALYVSAVFLPHKLSETERPANLLQRFGALFVDVFVSASIASVPVVIAALSLEWQATGEFVLEIRRDRPTSHDFPVSLGFLGLIIVWFLLSFPIALHKQSLGTIMFGYSIRNEEEPGILNAFLRPFIAYLTLCLAVVSIPMALRRKDRRMFHDLACLTWAVQTDNSNAK